MEIKSSDEIKEDNDEIEKMKDDIEKKKKELERYNYQRNAVCRICEKRLSYIGEDNNLHWERLGADDKGLICISCLENKKYELNKD